MRGFVWLHRPGPTDGSAGLQGVVTELQSDAASPPPPTQDEYGTRVRHNHTNPTG